ncbi:MAG: hypothetical protein GAK31_01041 [Stenotrophomonas maltophilia]|uniref:Restriction endonuclease type IV Mrr domain-containing protein n=1 Tax=Stenotrophomonas maltophilia TaxID=40324 RepID=A0A7V8JLZ5_STEMA|nr:MAG: hypothetical protein GAK31_01041 [Stenotrophomonas maltophilia]
MFSWILALLLALLSGGLAIVYLWWFKRRQKEMTLGLQALAGMHWREFSVLVKRALHEQRGLHDVGDSPAESREPSSDFLLSDGPHRWLVSCKHGLAYRIGTAAVNELGAAARLGGAKGGILITEGRVERDGMSAALKQGVDVLDGPRLWPLLQPYLPGDVESRVRASARNEAVRRSAIAVLGACTPGLMVGLGYQTAPPRRAGFSGWHAPGQHPCPRARAPPGHHCSGCTRTGCAGGAGHRHTGAGHRRSRRRACRPEPRRGHAGALPARTVTRPGPPARRGQRCLADPADAVDQLYR